MCRVFLCVRHELSLKVTECKPLSRGFCNSVHLVTRPTDGPVVVKLYSDLSLLRTEPEQAGGLWRTVQPALDRC
jgi:hypothetical protein